MTIGERKALSEDDGTRRLIGEGWVLKWGGRQRSLQIFLSRGSPVKESWGMRGNVECTLCFLFLSQRKSRVWLNCKNEEKEKNQYKMKFSQNQMEVIKWLVFLEVLWYKLVVYWGKRLFISFAKELKNYKQSDLSICSLLYIALTCCMQFSVIYVTSEMTIFL